MSIEELIEDLEVIRRKLQPRALSPAEYEAVGWADRPLRQLIDQAREEQDAQAWAQKHQRAFERLEPRVAMPEPLPALSEASP